MDHSLFDYELDPVTKEPDHSSHSPSLGPSHIMPPPPAARSSILRLMNASRHVACPCHTCSGSGNPAGMLHNFRKFATPVDLPTKEYAFEVGCTL
jgi:hypothetical protein